MRADVLGSGLDQFVQYALKREDAGVGAIAPFDRGGVIPHGIDLAGVEFGVEGFALNDSFSGHFVYTAGASANHAQVEC